MFELTQLPAAIKAEGGVSRRLFLAYGSALAAIPLLGRRVEGRIVRRFPAADNPFSLGVASGEPTAGGVVIWTRLAPKPLEPGGGMPVDNVEVAWDLAEDEAMARVIQTGSAVATPQLGHSIHVE